MKYVSLDLETTGLDPIKCQILELCAIVEPGEATFSCIVKHPALYIEAGAYHMNKELIEMSWGSRIPRNVLLEPREVSEKLFAFLSDYFNMNEGITFAGKNFGSFDKQFLKWLPGWNIKIAHRSLDVGSMYTLPSDDSIPSLAECCRRANLKGMTFHTAQGDAIAVIQLIRKKWETK